MARKTTKPHATQVQHRQRVIELVRIRAAGAKSYDVCEYMREKWAASDPVWGSQELSESQINRIIAEADAEILAAMDGDPKQIMALELAMRDEMYSRAFNDADYSVALSIRKDFCTLRNLYPAAKLNVNTTITARVTFVEVADAAAGDHHANGVHRNGTGPPLSSPSGSA